MPRRSSIIKDLVEIIASFPWWVGVSLALASYLLFSALAGQPLAVKSGPGVGPQLLPIFAGVLRYLVPLICLIAAGTSALERARRNGLWEKAKMEGTAGIASMSWRDFERFVGEALRRQGYSVSETGSAGGDGGFDQVLRRDGVTTLVQCKHWKTFRVGVPVVRELLGAMTAEGASRGWVVTSGSYTAEAEAFARQHGIRLIAGGELAALVQQGRSALAVAAGEATAPQHRDTRPTPPLDGATGAAGKAPGCPRCGKPMLRRVASRGTRAGQAFWGCRGYPECRGTRALD